MFSCFKRQKETEVNNDSKLSQKDIKKLEEKWRKECLAAHNIYRAKHGVNSLKLSKKLNDFANKWANHLADNNLLEYRKNPIFGENITQCVGLSYSPEQAVKNWYDEIKNYKFQEPGFAPKTAHFSQIVWKNTKKIGVAVTIRDNRIWVVCNYDPPANIPGEYLDNVLPPVDAAVSTLKRPLRPAKTADNESQPTTSKSKRSARDTKNWSEFELDCLDTHNKYRSMHGCPELILNRKLCNYATEWSKRLAKLNRLQHRDENDYGENLYYCMNYDPSGEDCVKSWYDEIKYYNYSKPGFSSKTGHFTAVIWKESKELGVGITKIANKTYVVCNYSPPGNVLNNFKDMVPPLGSKPSSNGNVSTPTENSKTSLQPKPISSRLFRKPKAKQNTTTTTTFEEVFPDTKSINSFPPMTINNNQSNVVTSEWTQVLRTREVTYTVRHN